MEISFARRFSMAHRLLHSGSSKCDVPHGHNELVTAHLAYCGDDALRTDANVASEFGLLKGQWHNWIDTAVDHALQLADSDPLVKYFSVSEPTRLARIMITPGDPSTELLAALFFLKYTSFLIASGAPFTVSKIELAETPTNSVSIDRKDLTLFPALAKCGWWNRPDMSINEHEPQLRHAASLS